MSSTIVPIPHTPRISSNQLGEFVFSTDARKRRILRDQKFGNKISSPYYQPVQQALFASFVGGKFEVEALERQRQLILSREAKNRNQSARWQNNAVMVQRFEEIESAARPPTGDHTIVRQNALITLDGVVVSVRPEIVTKHAPGLFCYTKLRFSKSKVSVDASEIILLVLLKYGAAQSGENIKVDDENTRLVDCFARTVIQGHRIPKVREQQLSGALREILALWPSIEGPSAPGEMRKAG